MAEAAKYAPLDPTVLRDPALRRQFQRDGYTVAPFLEPQDVQELLDVYRSVNSGFDKNFYTTLWSQDREYRRKVDEAIRRVFGPRLGKYFDGGRLILNQFAVKPSGVDESSRCPWHQDWSFADETKFQPVSLWCPLVDIDANNGPLAVVPGSHHLADRIRPNFPHGGHYPQLGELMPETRDKYAQELFVKAGDCVFYNGAMIHSSRPNMSDKDRPVVVAVVMPDDAPMRHYWRVNWSTVEVLEVDESMFRDEITWGSRPESGRFVAAIEHPVDQQPKSEAEFLAATGRNGGEAVRGAKAAAPRPIFRDGDLERRFREFGFVVAPLLDSEEVAELRDFFESTHTPALAGFHGTMYHADSEYRRRVDAFLRPRLTAAVSRILRDYRLCTCNFMVKEPGDDASALPLHQDWSFVGEPLQVAVHVWCPLVDVDHENGNLAVVPGSHHLSDPIRAFADDCPFREQFDWIRERYLVELPMKAGEAVLFDGRLIHSSPPNRSPNRRITTQAITVPVGAPIHHGWRVSPTQIELFEVSDEFFFDYVLHKPPQGVPSVGLVEYTVRQRTRDEVDQLEAYQCAEPSLATR